MIEKAESSIGVLQIRGPRALRAKITKAGVGGPRGVHGGVPGASMGGGRNLTPNASAHDEQNIKGGL